MATFNISGPNVVLDASIDTLLVASLPITTLREPKKRSANISVDLTDSGTGPSLPVTGQIWPPGVPVQ